MDIFELLYFTNAFNLLLDIVINLKCNNRPIHYNIKVDSIRLVLLNANCPYQSEETSVLISF